LDVRQVAYAVGVSSSFGVRLPDEVRTAALVLTRRPPGARPRAACSAYASLPARLPHPGRVVRTGCDYPLPIAAEHGAVDLSRMPADFGYTPARARLPHPGGAVRTGCDYPLPIAAEHGAVDLSRMPAQFGYSLACACLPYPCRLVIARRGYPLPIGAEYYTVYP